MVTLEFVVVTVVCIAGIVASIVMSNNNVG